VNSLPLHPAIVHLPIGLALLMPLLAAGFAWAIRTHRLRANAWVAIVALQALLFGSALVAMRTGAAEEHRVETVVEERVIHQHEEMAEQFVWGVGMTLALASLVLLVRRPLAARFLPPVVVVAAIVVVGLGLRVGRAGGELVYVHGAASAYGAMGGTGSPAQASAPRAEAEGVDRVRER
jgi:uncharacterized membrane protein